MCAYAGNVGHLMQHWTLCELLVIAGKHATGLNFIDAHAMAPLATDKQHVDAKFDRAQARLPNPTGSAYERAWHHLAPNGGGYPNSAAFVNAVWERDLSLLLCEVDDATCKVLAPWLQCVDKTENCRAAKLFRGDWRDRFTKGLPSPAEAGLADGALTLVTFDPNMCSRHRSNGRRSNRRSKKNLYPEDLELAMRATGNLEGGVLIQLSTYTANGGNAQGDVIQSLREILESKQNAFKLTAQVRVNGHMMSLVYARNVSWDAELTDLHSRFTAWLAAV